MDQQLINHPRLLVRHLTGREGPRHDPYSFDEYLVTTPKGHFVAHLGLAIFIIEDGKRIDARGDDYDHGPNWIDDHIREWTGFNIRQLERIHNEIQNRCHKGGYHCGDSKGGYPGEHFCVCQKCGKMYDYYFDESAVK